MAGHARNVERFAQLISFVQGYGADYAPSNSAITLTNLQAKLAESQTGIDGVSSARAPWTVVVNDRQTCSRNYDQKRHASSTILRLRERRRMLLTM